MNKLQMAHEWALVFTQQNKDLSVDAKTVSAWAFEYADAMQAEADKRNKEEAAQKRESIREILNADNTFLEKEGQHFDDVEWQPDWSKAPNGFDYFVKQYDDLEYFLSIKPDLEVGCWVTEVDAHWSDTIQNCPALWFESLRKRPQ